MFLQGSVSLAFPCPGTCRKCCEVKDVRVTENKGKHLSNVDAALMPESHQTGILSLMPRKPNAELYGSGGGSVAKSCLTLCGLIDCRMAGSSVLRCLPEFAICLILCHSLFPLSSFFPSQHVFPSQRVSSLHQEAKVLEHQRQSFQGLFRVDLL